MSAASESVTLWGVQVSIATNGKRLRDSELAALRRCAERLRRDAQLRVPDADGPALGDL